MSSILKPRCFRVVITHDVQTFRKYCNICNEAKLPYYVPMRMGERVGGRGRVILAEKISKMCSRMNFMLYFGL